MPLRSTLTYVTGLMTTIRILLISDNTENIVLISIARITSKFIFISSLPVVLFVLWLSLGGSAFHDRDISSGQSTLFVLVAKIIIILFSTAD